MEDVRTDRVERVVLAWLVVPRKKPSPAALAKGIEVLADGDSSQSKKLAGAAILRLRARGLVEPGSPLALSEKGRKVAIEALGVSALPRHADFRWAKKLLLIQALGLAITPPRINGAGTSEWLCAQILADHHQLSLGSDPTLSEVAQALTWRALGLDETRPLTASAAFAPLLLRGLEPGVAPSLESVLAAAPTSAAVRGDGLTEFALDVMEAARSAPTGRWHDKKVFISHVWASLQRRGTVSRITFDDFQRRLVEAHQARLLRLSRADLVEAMPRADVEASETVHLNATFHFVRIDDR